MLLRENAVLRRAGSLRRIGVLPTALIALGAPLIVACEREQPLRFAVVFEQNHDVEAGDEVVYKDIEVGHVTGVGLDDAGKVRVEVVVEPRYRGAVATSSIVAVERAGVLGGRRLVLRDGEGERRPLEPGAVLVGHEETSPGVLERLRAAGQTAVDRLGEVGADVERRLAELQDSPEAQELRDAMRRAGEQAAEGSQRLREEGVDAVRRSAAELEQRLEAEGKSEEAKALAERVQRWLEQLEGTPDESSN